MSSDEEGSEGQVEGQGEERILRQDEQNKVDELLRTFNDEPRFVAWIKKTKHGRTQSRILVIGNFRVITIKKGFKGKKVRRNGHLLDLTRIDSNNGQHVKLTFREDETDPLFFFLDIDYERAMEIAKHCIDAVKPMTVGYPDSHFTVNIADENRLPEEPFQPSAGGGFLETYKAMCNYYKQKESLGFIQYCRDLFESDSHVMNLSEVPGIETGTNFTFSLIPVFAALRHNHYFESIRLHNIVRKEVVSCLAECLQYNTDIKDVRMTFTGATPESFVILGKALDSNPGTVLHALDFSGNALRNNGVSGLAEGLTKLPMGLISLKLNSCSISGQGISELTDAFEANSSIPETMAELSLSYNNIGIDGSDRLSQWLSSLRFLDTIALRSLHLANTKVQLMNLCGAIRSSCGALEFLDIGFNKIDKKGAETLAVLLSSTTALHEINLSNCQLVSASVHLILHSICHNSKLQKVRINLSMNEIGAKGADHVARGIQGSTNLHTLILSDNNLMTEGISQVLDAFEDAPIEVLALDRNVQKKKSLQAARALAAFINKTTTLKELLLAGNKKLHFGGMIKPLFEAIRHNNSLRKLEVTGNMIEDEVINVLVESLRENHSLEYLYWDENKISLSGYQAFKSMINANDALSQMDFPNDDIQMYVSQSRDARTAKDRLKDVLDTIDQCLKRNGRERNITSPGFLVGRISDQFYASDPNKDSVVSRAGGDSSEGAKPIADLRRQVSYASVPGTDPYKMAPPKDLQYVAEAPAPPAPPQPGIAGTPPMPQMAAPLAPPVPLMAAPIAPPVPGYDNSQELMEPEAPPPPMAGFDPSMLATAIKNSREEEEVPDIPAVPDFDPSIIANAISEGEDDAIPPLPEF